MLDTIGILNLKLKKKNVPSLYVLVLLENIHIPHSVILFIAFTVLFMFTSYTPFHTKKGMLHTFVIVMFSLSPSFDIRSITSKFCQLER